MRLITLLTVAGMAIAPAFAQTQPAKPPTKQVHASKPVKKAPAAPTEPAEIDADRMAVVPLVHVGDAACAASKTVSVKPHDTLPGRFLLTVGNEQHTMTPQPTSTGVVRLENAKSGMVWLQVPVKSMLMDAKRGQRVADNCMHPAQAAEANSMK